jgi:hypothetical protein
VNIAILGAPGTGKTQLARELARCLQPPEHPPGTITDAPPLMAAIHADLLHTNPAGHAAALSQHRIYDLTLLTGLDLACPAERPTPEEPLSREAVDAQLRRALTQGAIAYAVIYGQGPARVQAALQAIASRRDDRIRPGADRLRQWQSACEKCSDPACEHRLFTDRLNIGPR